MFYLITKISIVGPHAPGVRPRSLCYWALGGSPQPHPYEGIYASLIIKNFFAKLRGLQKVPKLKTTRKGLCLPNLKIENY
jgi:hypothetical protein